jgi:hypothetical protein
MLLTWLQYLKDQVRLPLELCRVCYEVRGSGEYASLQLRARSGSPLSDHFDNIRHYIGRLNHTMKAVKITIETSLRLPDLFYDFEVVRANSPPAFPPPLRERNPTLFAIAGRLSSDTAVIQECRQGLEQLDHLHRLSEQLCSFCTSKDWRPRVHAELILLDLFWTSDFDFVAGDKYIACSKPACYCCYHYIREHPGRFVPPACHNNSWLNWRPPDIYDPTQANLIKVREDVLNEMTKKIRRDVFAQIAERRGPGKWRPDSLTEITSIRQEEFPFTDAEETSNRSMSGEDENETSDLKYSANETYEEQIVQEEDLETEDDEAGGVQLF